MWLSALMRTVHAPLKQIMPTSAKLFRECRWMWYLHAGPGWQLARKKQPRDTRLCMLPQETQTWVAWQLHSRLGRQQAAAELHPAKASPQAAVSHQQHPCIMQHAFDGQLQPGIRQL